jgi:hypothetical protein
MSLETYQRLFNYKSTKLLEINSYTPKIINILENLKIRTLVSYFKFSKRQENKIILQPISNNIDFKQINNPYLLFNFEDFLHIETIINESEQPNNETNFENLNLNQISLISPKFNVLQQACLDNLFAFKKDLISKKHQDLWLKLQHYSYFQNIHQNDKIGFDNYRSFCFLLNQFREKILNG